MSASKDSEKKCISVNLPSGILDIINDYKERIGKSQNSVLVELISKGLNSVNNYSRENLIYYFIKVRIDTAKMIEFGERLKKGELDTSNILTTYCIKDDPTVGVNIWQAKNQKCFEEVFALHKGYYKEVMEITQVTTPAEAMKLILENG